MSEASEKAGDRRLSNAIREVKNAVADRDDVVVEMREAHKMRIELLAAELAPVFAEVPADIDLFDFAVSSGLQPRLWIDAVAHVGMGRDRRTYRFVKDTRLGRVVLAESTEIKLVADQVARYVAERLIERERAIDGSVEPVFTPTPAATEGRDKEHADSSSTWSVIGLLVAGAVFGASLAVLLLWDRLAAIGSN